MKLFYLLLTIVGTIAPWYWFLQDPNTLVYPALFIQKAFANNISSALANDLLISGIGFFCFGWMESPISLLFRDDEPNLIGIVFTLGN